MPWSLARLIACSTPLAICIAAPVLVAQGSFEGVVTYQSGDQSANTPQTMTYSEKGDKVRMDMHDRSSTGQQMTGLYDMSTGTMTMVMPQMKGYMTMNLGDTRAKMQQKMDSTMKTQTVTKVGSETVAGVPCDDYQATDAKTGKQSFVCVAHGMGNWFMIGAGNRGALGGGGLSGGPFADMFKDGFFPLKMGEIENGKPRVQMVATSVERKTLDPSLFTVPPDYKQINMGDMGKMKQPGSQNPNP
jgi:Domain of unknown function (DUF4412)